MNAPKFPGAKRSISPAPASTSRWYGAECASSKSSAIARRIAPKCSGESAITVRPAYGISAALSLTSRTPGLRARRARARQTAHRGLAAAVLSQIVDETAHRREVRRVDQRTPLAATHEESRPLELRQVERQGRTRQLEPLRDPSRRKTLRPAGDERAEDAQPRLLRQRPERADRHRYFHDSGNIEVTGERQAALGRSSGRGRLARREAPLGSAGGGGVGVCVGGAGTRARVQRGEGGRVRRDRLPAERAGRPAARGPTARVHALSAADELRRPHRGQPGPAP